MILQLRDCDDILRYFIDPSVDLLDAPLFPILAPLLLAFFGHSQRGVIVRNMSP